MGDGSKSTLGGFDAFQMGGNYTRDGKKRIIAQKTVVIPGRDGVYVLQMNADALDGQEGPLMDATSVIDDKTTITPDDSSRDRRAVPRAPVRARRHR